MRGQELWVTDVRLPNMLHGRVVHPKTLGSTLQKVGTLDKTKFPNAQVIVNGNLVGVVAPTEWEAITRGGVAREHDTVERVEGPAGPREPRQRTCARRPTGPARP